MYSESSMNRMKNENYFIRPAGFKDAEPILGLIREYPEELLPRPISEIVQNIDRFLVCDAGDRIVGVVSWQILPEIGSPRDPSVEIKSLAVERPLRKEGIGSSLVAAALERIILLKPAQVIVLTFTPAFFRKLGFREIPKEKLMHKIYMGCVSCTKYDSPFSCPEVAMMLDPGVSKGGKKGSK